MSAKPPYWTLKKGTKMNVNKIIQFNTDHEQMTNKQPIYWLEHLEITQSSISLKKEAKRESPVELFPNLEYIPDDQLEKLGLLYYKAALQNKEMTVINEFFVELGICYSDVKKWRERNPRFARYFELGAEVIGIRREKNGNNLYATLYSGYAREDYEWRARVKSQAASSQINAQDVVKDIAKGYAQLFGNNTFQPMNNK